MNPDEQKRQVRKQMKDISAGLTQKYRTQADAAITDQVMKLSQYQSAQTLFCFVSLPGEVDTSGILADAFANGKRVCVPKCISDGVMKVYQIKSQEELEEAGAYHILEPKGRTGQEHPGENGCVAPEEIELAIVPCVSCSRDGKRLGHGGGYYDRYLAQTSAYKAVVCREKEMCEEIPVDAHDVEMDLVITENHIKRRKATC